MHQVVPGELQRIVKILRSNYYSPFFLTLTIICIGTAPLDRRDEPTGSSLTPEDSSEPVQTVEGLVGPLTDTDSDDSDEELSAMSHLREYAMGG